MTMQDIKWSDDLSVGVDLLDDSYKKLIDIHNILFAAARTGVSDEIVAYALKELLHHTRFHFLREEAYLAKKRYPSLGVHKLQHRKIIIELQDCVQQATRQGIAGLSDEASTFLHTWLITHIREHDHRYAAFLNAGDTAHASIQTNVDHFNTAVLG